MRQSYTIAIAIAAAADVRNVPRETRWFSLSAKLNLVDDDAFVEYEPREMPAFNPSVIPLAISGRVSRSLAISHFRGYLISVI